MNDRERSEARQILSTLPDTPAVKRLGEILQRLFDKREITPRDMERALTLGGARYLNEEVLQISVDAETQFAQSGPASRLTLIWEKLGAIGEALKRLEGQ